MSVEPTSAREALIAELLGDVHDVLNRMDALRGHIAEADASAKATTAALREATTLYQSQVNDMAARLRAETASIIKQTTEHAARSLVGQQSATLQKAATAAMQQAFSKVLLKHTRRDWLIAITLSSLIGAVVATLACVLWLRQ
jgi:Zn-dependent M16 (insulinase) family peptidase